MPDHVYKTIEITGSSTEDVTHAIAAPSAAPLFDELGLYDSHYSSTSPLAAAH